jgi:hypothetical protein
MGSRGAGSIRQRGKGRWEVRVSLGCDPVSGRSVYRSVTVQGELADVEERRVLLAAQAEELRVRRQLPLRTVADLLELWLAAQHDWKPSTWQGYRQTARRLSADPLAGRTPTTLSPPVLRAAIAAWQRRGVPTTTAALWARTLKAALGWVFDERLLPAQPLQGMRGPGQPEPRRDVPLTVVRELLAAAASDVEELRSAPLPRERARRLHTAEQVQLLLRLAADTGAHRGELGALHVDDLHDRVLHIDRGVSAEIVTTTKTDRSVPGCSPSTPTTDSGCGAELSATGSTPSPSNTATPTSACTGSGTPSRPSWSPMASSCKPNEGCAREGAGAGVRTRSGRQGRAGRLSASGHARRQGCPMRRRTGAETAAIGHLPHVQQQETETACRLSSRMRAFLALTKAMVRSRYCA